MQGMIRCVVIAGLVCACHSDDTASPDGPITGAAGMTVQWESKPDGAWPASLGSNITLKSARFAVDSLRVIGDAGPGDLRTTARTLEVAWGGGMPADISFTDAPTGLYSQLALQVDGHVVEDSYELLGTVVVNNNLEDFKVEDSNALPIMLQIEKTLSPGATSTITIRIDFANALSSVDFANLPKNDGKLQLDETNDGITDFRKKLVDSFSTPNITAH